MRRRALSTRPVARPATRSTRTPAEASIDTQTADTGDLKVGAKVTATIERLRAASELGAIDPAHARTLEEAYDLFSTLRLEHQIQQLARRYLRDAFHEVAAVQKSLSSGLV